MTFIVLVLWKMYNDLYHACFMEDVMTFTILALWKICNRFYLACFM